MMDPNNMKPTCICGEKMTLVEYRHYYGNERFWDCQNNKCQLNTGKEYMYSCEPDIIEDN